MVLGSGAGGSTAALVAAIEGLEVLVCEKMPRIGGTTATSGGTIWAPGAPPIRRAGGSQSAGDAMAYLEAELGDSFDRSLVAAFLESAPEMVDYLERNSEVLFEHSRNPDYHVESRGGSATGHAMTAVPFDGTMLGPDFERLQPPRDVFLVLSGMMVGRREIPMLIRPWASYSAARHTVARILRHVRARLTHERGTELLIGNALVARLLYSLRRRDVPVVTQARLVRLLRFEGRVTGAIVNVRGEDRFVAARQGVVLATGGFPHGERLKGEIAAAYPHRYSMALPGSCGDGIEAARAVGARIGPNRPNRNPAYWSPVSVRRRPGGSEVLWIHGHMDRGKPGLLAVDPSGRRFCNEADSYHDFVVSMFGGPDGRSAIPAYLICDERFVNTYGFGLARPWPASLRPLLSDGYLVKASTLSDLADALRLDSVTLEQTVARYNADARSGIDTLFGRGTRELNRFNGDPSVAENPCLRALVAPYYAIQVWPCSIGTTVGLVTDDLSRVLDDVTGAPILGLYACGNDMNAVMGGYYPGPGVTIGPAMTFAFRAARHAAAARDRRITPSGNAAARSDRGRGECTPERRWTTRNDVERTGGD